MWSLPAAPEPTLLDKGGGNGVVRTARMTATAAWLLWVLLCAEAQRRGGGADAAARPHLRLTPPAGLTSGRNGSLASFSTGW